MRYDLVHRLKQENPHLTIAINGGIRSLDEAETHLAVVDSVMIGRAAYETPYLLSDADRRLFGGAPGPDRHAVVEAMLPYVEGRLSQGTPLSAITRHMLGLFQGLAGARAWRRHISENAHLPGAGPEVLRDAAAMVPRRVAEAA